MRIIRKITPIHIFILTLSIILIHKIVQSDWTPMLFLVIGAAILDFGLMLLVDYFLHRQVGYCNQLQRIRTNYNEVAENQRLFIFQKSSYKQLDTVVHHIFLPYFYRGTFSGFAPMSH